MISEDGIDKFNYGYYESPAGAFSHEVEDWLGVKLDKHQEVHDL